MITAQLLNLSIEFAGVVLCVLGLVQTAAGTRVDRQTNRYFRLLFFVLILLSVSNAAGQLMRGLPGPG